MKTLTATLVGEIRQRSRSGTVIAAALASEYGVSRCAISNAAWGISFAHVPWDGPLWRVCSLPRPDNRRLIMPTDMRKYAANWFTEIRPAILERARFRCEGSPAWPECRAEQYGVPAANSAKFTVSGILYATP